MCESHCSIGKCLSVPIRCQLLQPCIQEKNDVFGYQLFETSSYRSTKRSTMPTVIKPVVFNNLDILTEILQNMIFINSTRDCEMSVKCPCAQHKKNEVYLFVPLLFLVFFFLFCILFVCKAVNFAPNGKFDLRSAMLRM